MPAMASPPSRAMLRRLKSIGASAGGGGEGWRCHRSSWCCCCIGFGLPPLSAGHCCSAGHAGSSDDAPPSSWPTADCMCRGSTLLGGAAACCTSSSCCCCTRMARRCNVPPPAPPCGSGGTAARTLPLPAWPCWLCAVWPFWPPALPPAGPAGGELRQELERQRYEGREEADGRCAPVGALRGAAPGRGLALSLPGPKEVIGERSNRRHPEVVGMPQRAAIVEHASRKQRRIRGCKSATAADVARRLSAASSSPRPPAGTIRLRPASWRRLA